MTDKFMDCITNPVKCKLLLEIHSQGKATAKHLADIYNDIPQATLYRHLKKMLNDGILQVVEETQVRGTVEKTYSLAYNINSDMATMVEENSGELYMQYFMQYFIGFAKLIVFLYLFVSSALYISNISATSIFYVFKHTLIITSICY